MIRQEVKELIKKSVKELQKEKKLVFKIPEPIIESPRVDEHGDYSSNIALVLSSSFKEKPIKIAKLIKEKIEKIESSRTILGKIEIREPGFVNFFISSDKIKLSLKNALKEGDGFGKLEKKRRKVQVEFISANPTGPLTLGNGRGGFCGDVISNVLEKAGLEVEREYYVNDAGEQIKKLGDSVLGKEDAAYKGEYINEVRKKINSGNPEEAGLEASKIILEDIIKPDVESMGIKFDRWFSEKSLHEEGKIGKALEYLEKKNLTYQKDGALWFKSSLFGDDKDRVLVKKGGEKTYFASDIAYMKDKFERNFDLLIYLWGADHYGYIERMKSACSALGYNKDQIRIIIMQLVRLIKEGKAMRMSKRKGDYVTLKELVDEVGLDVARFFFLQRASNTHLNFDLSLAKEKTEKNPVFYIQYAYARACSILKKSGIKEKDLKVNSLKELSDSSELNLSKKILRFPEIIEDTAFDYQVQRIPGYAMELTSSFHHFYHECRVISDSEKVSRARHLLVIAFKKTLKNTFDLMGISSPEEM
jgi:arginyl-tRNA synthetase